MTCPSRWNSLLTGTEPLNRASCVPTVWPTSAARCHRRSPACPGRTSECAWARPIGSRPADAVERIHLVAGPSEPVLLGLTGHGSVQPAGQTLKSGRVMSGAGFGMLVGIGPPTKSSMEGQGRGPGGSTCQGRVSWTRAAVSDLDGEGSDDACGVPHPESARHRESRNAIGANSVRDLMTMSVPSSSQLPGPDYEAASSPTCRVMVAARCSVAATAAARDLLIGSGRNSRYPAVFLCRSLCACRPTVTGPMLDERLGLVDVESLVSGGAPRSVFALAG